MNRETDDAESWKLSEDYLADPAVAPLRSLVSAWARELESAEHVERRTAHAVPGAAPICPLWSRLFDAFPVRGSIVGAGIGLLLFAAFCTLDWLDGNWAGLVSGEVPFWSHVEVRSALVVSALLAGVLVTQRSEQRATRRDLARLAPQLRGGTDDLVREVGSVSPRSLRRAGALGAVLITALVPTLYLDPARFLEPVTLRMPSVLFDLAVGAVLGWTLFRSLWAAIQQDRAFARLSERVKEVDLLDLTPLHPFARRGQRRALRWLVLATIASLVFLDAGLVAAPAAVFAAIIGFALTGFVLPVHGIHRRIREEKRTALERLREDIHHERERLRMHLEEGIRPGNHPDDSARSAHGHLADLLALEERLAAAREWPVDTSMALRLVLILLLPLGSWLGGAVVERALAAALG